MAHTIFIVFVGLVASVFLVSLTIVLIAMACAEKDPNDDGTEL